MKLQRNEKVDNQVKNREEAEILGAVEAILFAAGEAVTSKKLCDVFECTPSKLKEVLAALREKLEYSGGLELLEVDGGYRLTTKKEYSEYLDRFFNGGKRKGLSNAALEVLAIIAMKQPVTKAEIEEMRGVSSDSIVQHLLKRELIYCSGKLDKIGNPSHYSTTDKFLEVFDLISLDELPNIDEWMLV